ncbi:MAG: T9SS type A sorting domain-containing protein [bacterium]
MTANNAFKFTVVMIVFIIFNSSPAFAQCTAYIGQTLPGMLPVKYAPTNSYLANGSWWWRSAPLFSPDENEMYFTKYLTGSDVHEVWFTKCTNGTWALPKKAPFSTTSYDGNPLFLQSNDTLYFYSRRPGGFIFQTTRTETGWSEPVALNIPLPTSSSVVTTFFITKNKNVYLAIMENNDFTSADIYCSTLLNGQYTFPKNLGAPINTNIGEVVGYVDPDERFMIFSSPKDGGFGWHDMYISERNQNGTWSNPINLGSTINGSFEDDTPMITPDGKYFFFTTQKPGDNGYTPYWVDAQIIYNLLTDVEETQETSFDFTLNQNYPNPFNPSTVISYNLPKAGFVSLKIFDILGKEISSLINREQSSGIHEVKFDAGLLTGGVYFYQLVSGKYKETKKMILLQ